MHERDSKRPMATDRPVRTACHFPDVAVAESLPPIRECATNFLVHLRLPFQLVLAPFMLWGAALAHARISPRFLVAFVVLHVCFYGGTTAYNSHYDRDEGPVGGLANPPPAGPWLLPGSFVLQGLGLIAAAGVSDGFLLACAAFAILGVLYSHPRTRWKGKPWASWLVVMIGQGGLGTLAGMVADRHARWSLEMVYGIVAAVALVGALYPLTQLFQIAEDRKRGDRTVAIVLGRRGVALAAAVLSTIGSAFAALSARAGGRPIEAAVLAGLAVPMIAGALWVCRPNEVKAIYRRISVVQIAAGAAFGVYAVVRLIVA
ncbi:hypothetical protein AKJ09_05227 [Labilithrix luteola]|uniref:1,4-dihydroxy-2-naphthoate octaprenyltransferase n=1 Tax=Labilithrix luteola TaxID=1391654 RepID=A0A0K1PYF8_9BACT|nr:UbiA family prenyltransferase [Labilithrix luteola]AKU98563.1 hypothetical protein AKJ09_05227 [Labilithrix luteola]